MVDWDLKDKHIQMAQAYNCAIQEACVKAKMRNTVEPFQNELLKIEAMEHYNNLEELKKGL